FLLSSAARITAALVGTRADAARLARLLGAADALTQATGATLLWQRMPGGQDVTALSEQLEKGGWGGASHEGRTRPCGEAATLARALLEEVAQALASPETAQPPTLEPMAKRAQGASPGPLSAREHEVLRLVAQGRSNKAIGRELFISPS